MKTRCLLIVFAITLSLAFSLTLPAEDPLLAEFDLAGMPPESLPPSGAILHLEAEESCPGTLSWAVQYGEQKIGYIPARFHPQMEQLLRGRTRFTLHVKQVAPTPRPGQFLRIALRVSPRFPDETFPEFNPPEELEFEDLLAFDD